jgi:hypothetical protein
MQLMFKTKGIWLAVLSIALLSCSKDPVSTTSTNNPDVQVSLLLEHDGIKVYRFYDNGTYIYYIDARGEAMWRKNLGKTTVPVEVETVK